MSPLALEFIVPGDLQSASGGYVYDRSMVEGLRTLGWQIRVHELDASFPSPSSDALAHADRVCVGLPDGACVLVDGLALGAMPELIETHAQRLALVALVHMPLAWRIGIESSEAERLRCQEQRALQCVRHVIVTSRATERDLTSWGIDPSLVSIVEPGVWMAPSADARDRASEDGVVKLLCVATIQEGKGHELLVDALASLRHLPWHLRCVGSLSRNTATAQRLRERIEGLGLAGRIVLAGELPHAMLSELYLAADLFVLPTLRESYGMAVAESLAHGLPVISSYTGAIPDLVGTAGLLHEPGDRNALRGALSRALSDPALRASLRVAALQARAQLTPWPLACARLARILKRFCDRAASQ
jgi:glycosyltransferase involved in cell wall biosynthesis